MGVVLTYAVVWGVTALVAGVSLYYLNEVENDRRRQHSRGTTDPNKSKSNKKPSKNEPSRNSGRAGSSNGSSGGTGSNQPNNTNDPSSSAVVIEDDPIYQELLEIFRNFKNYTDFLKKLNIQQRKHLIKELKILIIKNGYKIKDVMKIVIELFRLLGNKVVIGIEDFLSLTNFTMVYIREQKEKLMNIDATRGNLKARNRSLIIQMILDNKETNCCSIRDMISIYLKIEYYMQYISYYPKFRNIACAIYHYYKHRVVSISKYNKNNNETTIEYCELSLKDYFNLMDSSLLETLRNIKNKKKVNIFLKNIISNLNKH